MDFAWQGRPSSTPGKIHKVCFIQTFEYIWSCHHWTSDCTLLWTVLVRIFKSATEMDLMSTLAKIYIHSILCCHKPCSLGENPTYKRGHRLIDNTKHFHLVYFHHPVLQMLCRILVLGFSYDVCCPFERLTQCTLTLLFQLWFSVLSFFRPFIQWKKHTT